MVTTVARLLFRFPTTVLLSLLLGFYALTTTGVIGVGPIAQLLIFPVVVAAYLVDPVGALATRLGLPSPSSIEVGLLVLGALAFDWALRRATQ